MTKQELAQKRNHLKFRLIGTSALFKNLSSTLTTEEMKAFGLISSNLTKLINEWDSSSQLKGLNLKPYKCKFCGKRSNKSYIIKGNNYCLNHYKIYNEDGSKN